MENLFVKVDLKKVRDLLDPIKTLIADKEKSSFSRYILLDVTKDTFTVKVSSIDSNYKFSLPVLNTENNLEGLFIVEYDILMPLLEYLDESLILQKEGEDLMIEVLSGKVPLKVYSFNFNIYAKLDEYKSIEPKTFNITENFKNILDIIILSLGLNNNPESRKLKFTTEGVFNSFNHSLAKYNFKDLALNLRAIDIKFLNHYISKNNIEYIKTTQDKSNIYFELSDTSLVSFQKVKTEDLDFVVSEFNQLEFKGNKISIPLNELSKRLGIMLNLVGKYSDVVFSITNSVLTIESKTSFDKVINFEISKDLDIENINIKMPIHILNSFVNILKSTSNDFIFILDSKNRINILSDYVNFILAA